MEKIICQNCNIEFLRNPSRKAKYCSNKCSRLSKRNKIVNYFNEYNSYTCYWAGFLFGDGSVNKNNNLKLGLTNKDYAKKHLEKFCKFLFNDINKIRSYPLQVMTQVTNEQLCSNLSKFGIIPNKTYSGIMKLPNKFYCDFIRGFFDADGWASFGYYPHMNNNKYYMKPSIGFCSYIEENLLIIKQKLNNIGHIHKKKKQHLYEYRLLSREDIQTFVDLCKSSNKEIYYEYKWNKIWDMPFLIK